MFYQGKYCGELKMEESTKVKISSGYITGCMENNIRVYKNIPYAEPPVGDRRFQAPVPHGSWLGIKKCDKYGNIPWQLPGMVGQKALETYPQSEDCLFVNIWAEKDAKEQPVLFWIHGGGFQGGVAHEELYDGTWYATHGCIVVSVAYRLGAFGFLALPELEEESKAANGNFGLLDVIEGLKWVNKNIAAFGGNPEKITIAGQSAGAMMVQCLLASPLAKGLFCGAIIQSGGFGKNFFQDAKKNEFYGKALMKELDCTTLKELREKSADEILHAAGNVSDGKIVFCPSISDCTLPLSPLEALKCGKAEDVPILIGSNSHEDLTSPAGFGAGREDFLKAVKAVTGEKFEEFGKWYKTECEDLSMEAGGDLDYYYMTKLLNDMTKRRKTAVFRYYFDHSYQLDNGNTVKASHSAELFSMFHTLKCMGGSTLNGSSFKIAIREEDEWISERMCKSWLQFIKYQNPSAEEKGKKIWTAFTHTDPKYMYFGENDMMLYDNLHPEKMRYWETALKNQM